LFSDYNLKSFYYTSAAGDVSTTYCRNFLHTQNSQIPSIDQNNPVGTCYKDKSQKTGLNYYKSCDEVKSCYDYKTKDGCQQDYCYRFTTDGENGCEWREYNNELGIVVCVPKDLNKQECNLCDTDSPIGFCDEEMCGLYGDCYFKQDENHDLGFEKIWSISINPELEHKNYLNKEVSAPYTEICLPKENMGCLFYDNEDDCVGNQTSKSQVKINVKYETNYTTMSLRKALIGDNKQIQFSQDKFHFGDCFWNDDNESQHYGCNKNSDGFFQQLVANPSEEGVEFSDDCVYNTNEFFHQCFNDYTPPKTKILLRDPSEQSQYISNISGSYLPVYGSAELANLTLLVNDSQSPTNAISTYFSFIPIKECRGCIPFVDINISDTTINKSIIDSCYERGCELYPQHKLSELQNNEFRNGLLKNGENVVIYFSEDGAHNLEEVNHFEIYIDSEEPHLTSNFTYDVKTKLMAEEDAYVVIFHYRFL